MATVAEIQAAACVTGIGRETNPLKLLQYLAQTSADFAAANVSGLDVQVPAVMSRACDSGIGQETDQVKLLQIIAQLLNDSQ